VWPVPGALSGAALGFQAYFLQPGLNRDTLAPLAFGAMSAFAGLLVGVLVCAAAGRIIEAGLRRIWPEKPTLTSIVTLACLVGMVLASTPALDSALPTLIGPPGAADIHARGKASGDQACGGAAPADAAQRREWELECR
jgi:hypothetical protein